MSSIASAHFVYLYGGGPASSLLVDASLDFPVGGFSTRPQPGAPRSISWLDFDVKSCGGCFKAYCVDFASFDTLYRRLRSCFVCVFRRRLQPSTWGAENHPLA